MLNLRSHLVSIDEVVVPRGEITDAVYFVVDGAIAFLASAHASAGRRVARLGSFCDQSRRSLDALDRRRLAPMALKLRAVCEYFGEIVADDAAAPAKASYVFTTVGAFLRALDGAVAQASRVARREASLQKSLALTRRASSGDVEVERGERDNRPRRRAHSAVLT